MLRRISKTTILTAATFVTILTTNSALAECSTCPTSSCSPCGSSWFSSSCPMSAGWYVEGNIGQSKLQNVNFGTGTSIASSTGFGWNVDGGYKFMPYFGAEIGYTRYPNASIRDISGATIATDRHYAYDLAGKAILPISNSGVEFFAKLGISRIRTKTVQNSTTPAPGTAFSNANTYVTGGYYAIGADYVFNPNLAANIQWATANGNGKTGNISLFSLGLNYIFE